PLLVSVRLGGGAATGDLVTVTKRVSGRDGPLNAKGSGPYIQMLHYSPGCREGRNRKKALPVVGHLDGGLRLSPQGLGGHNAIEVRGVVPRKHIIHGACQCMRQHGEGFGFAVLGCECRKRLLAWLMLPSEEPGGFGKGPAPVPVANLLPGRAQSFAP
ncbi:MAG TPA: hypothetical protein VGX03_37800, partial [Candidatus Binatia bacterium]|nr:hypothetical protein [Candidatus Binatia bacterium]